MKFQYLLVYALALAGFKAATASVIDAQVIQNGNDITLNWSLLDAPDGYQGLAFEFYAYDPARYSVTSIFIGIYTSTSGSIEGTITDGWTGPNFTYIDYTFHPNGHTPNIFDIGNHSIFAEIYGPNDISPYDGGFNPDGPIRGTGNFTNMADYYIADPSASVPDYGCTSLLIACSVIGLTALKNLRPLSGVCDNL